MLFNTVDIFNKHGREFKQFHLLLLIKQRVNIALMTFEF